MLLLALERGRIRLRHRNAQRLKARLGVRYERRKRIVLHDARVIASRDIAFFRFLEGLPQHHQRAIRVAVKRIAVHKFEQTPARRANRTFNEVVARDAVIALGQNFLYLAQALLSLRSKRVIRIFGDKALQFVFGVTRVGAVAVRFLHPAVVRDADLHLRVRGFFGLREENFVVLVLSNRLRQAGAAAFLEERVRDRQLGLREIFAIGIGVDQRLQREPRDDVLAIGEILHCAVV